MHSVPIKGGVLIYIERFNYTGVFCACRGKRITSCISIVDVQCSVVYLTGIMCVTVF